MSEDFDPNGSYDIFGDVAPKYWNKNIPVIPLLAMQKRPFFDDWTQFCSRMPNEEEQIQWMNLYRRHNVGLPLGIQSGLCMIDFDYLDEDVKEAVLRVLPHSPWKRVGQKGFVMAYRYNDTKPSKIYDCDGKMVVEILSTGNQVVLPPSIHPDTLKPYVANCNLYEVLDQIPPLPHDCDTKLRMAIEEAFNNRPEFDEDGVEIRRMSLRSKGSAAGKFKASEYVPMGARDVQMTRHAGSLARLVIRGEISLKIALDDMRSWFDLRVEKVEGDNIDINKGMGKIIQFLVQDVQQKGKILPPGWDADLSEEDKNKWGLVFNESQEEWTLQQLINYIQNANDSLDKNSEEMKQVEMFVLTKLAKSQRLNDIDIEKVINQLRAKTKVNKNKYEKTIKAMRAGPVQGISQTEIAEQVIKDLNERYSSTDEQ